MPDIGYYTLPVIPSFRGIESATQDQLDKAFRGSGKKSGEAFADEHDKAFRDKTVESARNPDTTTIAAHKQRGAAAGKAEADAHNEAFNKTRADDPAAAETAKKVGTESGKASGKAAGDAHNEELKKTTQAQADSIGKALGKALGSGAGSAAAEMIEDMLPKALRGLGLQGVGRDLGEQLGGAIGDHLSDIPGKIVDGVHTAREALKGSGGVAGIADDIRDGMVRARDAVHGLADGIHGINLSSVKDALGGIRDIKLDGVVSGMQTVSGLVKDVEPTASAMGFDISGWANPLTSAVDQATAFQGAFKELSGFIAEAAPGMAAAMDVALGPLAIGAAAIAGLVAGINQIRNATDPSRGFVAPPGQNPVQTPAGQMALPGQPQPVQLPPSVPPGTQYNAQQGSLDPFAALQPAGTTALTPQQQQPRVVLPPSPFGVDVGGHQAGGGIFGPGPKGQDSVLMWGAPGEHVWTAAEVEKAGGHGAMHALRAAVRGYDKGGAVGDDWDAIAQKESGGNWAINTGNGYYGGLQFDLSTWHDFGGDQFAPRPDMTSRENQIAVANRVPPEQRARRWPNTYTAGAGRGGGMQGVGGGDFGAAMGHPTAPPPNENAVRSWVQQNFGIPNTFGTGSWENAAHDADGMWHHNLTHDKSQPGYAFDFHGTPQQMDALANWVADNYKDKTLELIHQGPGFDHNREIKNARFGDVYGAGVNAAHADHVHWAMTSPPNALGGAAAGPGLDPRDLPRGRKGDPVFVTSADGGAGGTGGAAGGNAAGKQSAFQKAGGAAGLLGIGKQALSDTFGFGSILPGLDDMPGTQFLFGMLDNLLGGGGGGQGMGGGLGDIVGNMAKSGGFGMIPGMGAADSNTTPGGIGPPAFDPALPGLSAGLGDARTPGQPQNVDQSVNLTVNGRSDDDMITRVRRELINNPPRALTNAPPGH